MKGGGVFIDGDRIYFNESVGSKSVISSVALGGGNVDLLPMIPAGLLAISNTRHSLLVRDETNNLYEVRLGSLAFQQILLPPGVSAGAAAWDPQGHRIAIESLDSLTVFEPGKEKPLFQAHFPGPANVSGWDPQGHHLRFEVWETKAEVTHWWDLSENSFSAQPLPHFSPNPREIHGTWTSDGRFFAFEGGTLGQTQIWVVDLNQRPPKPYQLTLDARTWHDPTFVPGSNTIIATAGQTQGQLVTLPVSARAEEQKTILPGVSAYELDYSRDGQWVAYTRFPEHTTWRCRLDGSDARQISPPGLEAHQPHWSPDGTRIAVMGRMASNKTRWHIYLASSSGGGLEEPLPEGDDQGVPTWTPDGRSLVFGDRTTYKGFDRAAIHLLNLQTREATTVSTPTGMWSPRMSPDGKHLAAVSFDSKSLYIRDNDLDTWRKCVAMNFLEEVSWPLDSSFVQFSANTATGGRGLFRVSPQCEAARLVVDTSGYQLLGDTWFGIGPDHAPMAFLRMPDEVYAIDWRLRRRIP
jgi:Tol biopolymer transport system component